MEKVLLSIELGISPWDIKVIISALKAKEEDIVSYKEELDWITETIMAFLHRPKIELKFEWFKETYEDEIIKISQLLSK